MKQAEYQQILNQIPWHSLRDAYGPALPMRTLLEKIASSSSYEEGVTFLMDLDDRMNHQAVLEKCVLDIIPALVALAQLPEISVLPSLLSYLLYLISNGQFESFNPTSSSKEELQPLQNQIREILSEHTDLWLQFLEHPEPKCRSRSTQLLVVLQKPSQKLDNALRLAYQQEKDLKTCATFLLCRGILFQSTENLSLLLDLKTAVNHSSSLIQTCAAIAHSFVSPMSVNEQIWQLLQAAATQHFTQPAEKDSYPQPIQSLLEEPFTCFYNSLQLLVIKALVRIGQDQKERVVASLLQAVRHLHQQQKQTKGQNTRDINKPPLSDWWAPDSDCFFPFYQIAKELFSVAFAKFQSRKQNPVLLEELDELQRQILTVWGYELDHVTSVHSEYGFPGSGKVYMGRYLGILPWGPLDQKLSIEISKDALPPSLKTMMTDSKWPLWKWIWLSFCYPSLQEKLIEQLLIKQTFEQNIALCQDLIICPYLHFSADWRPSPFVHQLWTCAIQQQGYQALPTIRDYANQLVKKSNEQEILAREAALVLEAFFQFDPQMAQAPEYQSLREKAKPVLQQRGLFSKLLYEGKSLKQTEQQSKLHIMKLREKNLLLSLP